MSMEIIKHTVSVDTDELDRLAEVVNDYETSILRLATAMHAARKAFGHSIAVAAEASGVSEHSIRRAEAEERDLTADEARSIIDWLRGLSDPGVDMVIDVQPPSLTVATAVPVEYTQG